MCNIINLSHQSITFVTTQRRKREREKIKKKKLVRPSQKKQDSVTSKNYNGFGVRPTVN